MKKLMSLLLLLLLVLSLVACSSESIVGEWNPEGVEELEGFEEALMVITDTEMIILGAAIPYTLDGNKITITTEGSEETINYSFDGDKLILSAGGETQTFIRVK
jgi:uncharacterized lipoprotein YehR (DUF1307 family)